MSPHALRQSDRPLEDDLDALDCFETEASLSSSHEGWTARRPVQGDDLSPEICFAPEAGASCRQGFCADDPPRVRRARGWLVGVAGAASIVAVLAFGRVGPHSPVQATTVPGDSDVPPTVTSDSTAQPPTVAEPAAPPLADANQSSIRMTVEATTRSAEGRAGALEPTSNASDLGVSARTLPEVEATPIVDVTSDVPETDVLSAPAIPAVPLVDAAVIPANTRPLVGLSDSITPVRQVSADDAAIEALLQTYRISYTELDAPSVAAVWPTVDVRSLTRAFSTLQNQEVLFEGCAVALDGATASASCTGRIRYVRRLGDSTPRTQELTWAFELVRRAKGWQIADVHAR